MAVLPPVDEGLVELLDAHASLKLAFVVSDARCPEMPIVYASDAFYDLTGTCGPAAWSRRLTAAAPRLQASGRRRCWDTIAVFCRDPTPSGTRREGDPPHAPCDCGGGCGGGGRRAAAGWGRRPVGCLVGVHTNASQRCQRPPARRAAPHARLPRGRPRRRRRRAGAFIRSRSAAVSHRTPHTTHPPPPLPGLTPPRLSATHLRLLLLPPPPLARPVRWWPSGTPSARSAA